MGCSWMGQWFRLGIKKRDLVCHILSTKADEEFLVLRRFYTLEHFRLFFVPVIVCAGWLQIYFGKWFVVVIVEKILE